MSDGPVTASWSPLLRRMLSIIDALASWSEDIIERLYVNTGGQVDKPFPTRGDILGIYMAANRLYKGSPQGWFIVTPRRLQRSKTLTRGSFWCYCVFLADIPPIPDLAVPWKGSIDVWTMRDKLSDRPQWIRLTDHEEDGCSYYNLSDWIRAKRSLNDKPSAFRQIQAQIVPVSPLADKNPHKRQSTSKHARFVVKPKHKQPVPVKRVTRPSPPKRRRRADDEYVHSSDCESSESSMSYDEKPVLHHTSVLLALGPLFTTGKMSAGVSEPVSITTTPSLGNTPRRAISSGEIESPKTSELLEDPTWLSIREDTQQSIIAMLSAKAPQAVDQPWLVNLARQLETDAIFANCHSSQDRYEGLTRAVVGIIHRFECLADAVETLIPLQDLIRTKLKCLE